MEVGYANDLKRPLSLSNCMIVLYGFVSIKHQLQAIKKMSVTIKEQS